jgi:threonine-phosphate decarboxylase
VRKVLIDAGTCVHGGSYSVDPRMVKIDFSSNVNPLGVSRKVIGSIRRDLALLSSSYPDPQCRELKQALSNYLNVASDNITVGNGATDIIHNFARLFAKKKVIIPAPSFCEYELASRRMGAEVLLVPLRNSNLDADEIIEKTNDNDALFLCNPNNPTGLLYKKSLKTIIEQINSSTKILVDECFVELVNHPERHTMIKNINEFDNVIILRSLTKSFGLAGLRLGYSVSSPIIAKRLTALQASWNVNRLAQKAGVAALKDLQHLLKAREIIKKQRNFMYYSLRSKTSSFIPSKSDANFFLIHVPPKKTSKEIRDTLLSKFGILVRDCSTFSGMGSSYIRVSVKKHFENLKLLHALESITY